MKGASSPQSPIPDSEPASLIITPAMEGHRRMGIFETLSLDDSDLKIILCDVVDSGNGEKDCSNLSQSSG